MAKGKRGVLFQTVKIWKQINTRMGNLACSLLEITLKIWILYISNKPCINMKSDLHVYNISLFMNHSHGLAGWCGWKPWARMQLGLVLKVEFNSHDRHLLFIVYRYVLILPTISKQDKWLHNALGMLPKSWKHSYLDITKYQDTVGDKAQV